MLFNSIQFVIFFVAVTVIYFAIPHKMRWLLLLIASCYFYMAFVPVYILILGFTIVIDYFAGILIENAAGKRRKLYLLLSLIANIGVLCVFKYYNFFNDNITAFLANFGIANHIPYLKILLPIGLSFHTFQAMSYTIEVYRGKFKAERHFGVYALYVMFFPQLVAGPIERPQNVLPQLHKVARFNYDDVVTGLKFILWGFFKKLVIADRLAIYVNTIYNNSSQHSGYSLLLATFFFAFQIYCDFSGYSDIAIGTAKILGIDLMINFKRPYFSRTISEFWKRWHISLSTWFSDYLYISLGGNRVSIPRWYFNLVFVFLISGLWHGANWTFVIWGLLNGCYLVFALITAKGKTWFNTHILGAAKFPGLFSFIQILTTFVLIMFSWIFFRAENLKHALSIIKKIATFKGPLFFNENPSMVLYPLLGIFILLSTEYIGEYYKGISLINNKSKVVRYCTYVSLTIMIVLFGVFDGGQFIYFQF